MRLRLRHTRAFALQTLSFTAREVRRRDDANIAAGVDKAFEHKQVAAAVHDAVGIVSDRSADNHTVIRVAAICAE